MIPLQLVILYYVNGTALRKGIKVVPERISIDKI